MMEKVKGFLKKKDIVFSVKRYGIDALLVPWHRDCSVLCLSELS